MNNVKKIAVSLLIPGRDHRIYAGGDSSRIQVRRNFAPERGFIGPGIGFRWGSGTLTYKGKDYPVKVNGLSVGKVGMTGGSPRMARFSISSVFKISTVIIMSVPRGTRGVTVGSGKAGTVMTNQAGVIVRLSATQKGVDVNATGGGVDMQLK